METATAARRAVGSPGQGEQMEKGQRHRGTDGELGTKPRVWEARGRHGACRRWRCSGTHSRCSGQCRSPRPAWFSLSACLLLTAMTMVNVT